MIEEEEDEPLDLGVILKKRKRPTSVAQFFDDDDDDDDDDLDEASSDSEDDEATGPRKFIIDSNKEGVAGGVSGRELVASMMRFGKGENTWVRQQQQPKKEEGLDDGGRPADLKPEAALANIAPEALDAAAKATTSFRRAAFDIDLDGLDDKPWQRPDADPSDYFNYGMNEAAWRAYVRQQLIVRRELQERRSKFAAKQRAAQRAQAQNQAQAQNNIHQSAQNPILGGFGGDDHAGKRLGGPSLNQQTRPHPGGGGIMPPKANGRSHAGPPLPAGAAKPVAGLQGNSLPPLVGGGPPRLLRPLAPASSSSLEQPTANRPPPPRPFPGVGMPPRGPRPTVQQLPALPLPPRNGAATAVPATTDGSRVAQQQQQQQQRRQRDSPPNGADADAARPPYFMPPPPDWRGYPPPQNTFRPFAAQPLRPIQLQPVHSGFQGDDQQRFYPQDASSTRSRDYSQRRGPEPRRSSGWGEHHQKKSAPRDDHNGRRGRDRRRDRDSSPDRASSNGSDRGDRRRRRHGFSDGPDRRRSRSRSRDRRRRS